MKPTPAVSLGGRLIAEFDDDAADFAAAEPEFVPVRVPPMPVLSVAVPAGSPYPFSPPSEEAAAGAKKFWLKVIRRFTEPVPGKRGRVRVSGSAEPNQGRIRIDYGPAFPEGGRSSSGYELDVTDKLFLAVLGKEFESATSHPIFWTEITDVRFEVLRTKRAQ